MFSGQALPWCSPLLLGGGGCLSLFYPAPRALFSFAPLSELRPLFPSLPPLPGISAAVRAEGVRRGLRCPDAQESVPEGLGGSCK